MVVLGLERPFFGMKECSDGKTEARFGVYVKFYICGVISSDIGEKKF